MFELAYNVISIGKRPFSLGVPTLSNLICSARSNNARLQFSLLKFNSFRFAPNVAPANSHSTPLPWEYSINLPMDTVALNVIKVLPLSI